MVGSHHEVPKDRLGKGPPADPQPMQTVLGATRDFDNHPGFLPQWAGNLDWTDDPARDLPDGSTAAAQGRPKSWLVHWFLIWLVPTRRVGTT